MGCGGACGSCGTSTDGKPAGCQGNGYCGSQGCNRLSSFDWFANVPLPPEHDPMKIVEVSFKNGASKAFYKNKVELVTGDLAVVRTETGYDIGRISLSGELVRLQMRKKKVKEDSDQVLDILRRPTQDDLQKWEEAKNKEMPTMTRARAIVHSLGLEMKVGDVEYSADKKRITFYYTADGRVDFRELIRKYASEFHVKIKMHQIGARQEAGRIGGIGDCGRELCCSTWLTEFKTVSTSAARYQNLSINQAKLSGQCGRLKCCLNYELDTYLDALKDFPEKADKFETVNGIALLQKTDIFKGLMWYRYESESRFYSLTTKEVKESLAANVDGKKAKSLSESMVHEVVVEKEDPAVVGQISLTSLKTETKQKRRRKKRPSGKHPNRGRKRGRGQRPKK